jgi:short-subunit dehydrogenase
MKTVLITGASSGIGAALVNEYVKNGYRVVLVARRLDAMQKIATDAGLASDKSRFIVCDIRDTDAWRAQAAELIAIWGCPDVVIANAGISVGVMTEDPADYSVFKDVMETNWLATMSTFQPFVAPMRERGSGRLAGVASVAGIRGLGGHAAYCASKAAVIKSLESLRLEMHNTGVKVVTICPGFIATPLTSANPYSMPFLMPAHEFAARCYKAVEAGVAYRTIPWQMGWVSTLLKFLPIWLYDKAMARRKRKPRASEQSKA